MTKNYGVLNPFANKASVTLNRTTRQKSTQHKPTSDLKTPLPVVSSRRLVGDDLTLPVSGST